MGPSTRRPRLGTYLLGALVTFQGLSGIVGGYGLTMDPTGEDMGIPRAWLEGTLFPDYLVPGVFLFTVLGIGPLIVAYGIWTRRRWSWAGSLMVGLVLLVWLVVEVAVIGYKSDPPFQAGFAAVALAIVALSLTPSVRTGLRRRGEPDR